MPLGLSSRPTREVIKPATKLSKCITDSDVYIFVAMIIVVVPTNHDLAARHRRMNMDKIKVSFFVLTVG